MLICSWLIGLSLIITSACVTAAGTPTAAGTELGAVFGAVVAAGMLAVCVGVPLDRVNHNVTVTLVAATANTSRTTIKTFCDFSSGI